MTISRFFCLLGALFIALAIMPAMAAADTGTASGTSISNVARVHWKVSGVDQDTVTPSSDTTVRTIASDTITDAADLGLAVGETKVYTYSFFNTGNKSDSFNIWISDTTPASGAIGWIVSLYVNGVYQTAAINDTKISAVIAPDAAGSCSVAVWAHSTPANSPDGSNVTYRLWVEPWSKATADTTEQYTGDNGNVYAYGNAGSTDTAKATIAAPIITLTKAITSVSIGGVATHPLPGASILYTLTYNNAGSASADQVIIRDTIPTNTTFDTASFLVGDATLGASATFHLTDSSSGWVCQVATMASPAQGFVSADYTTLSAFGGTISDVTHVRWVRTVVANAETDTVRFRVIIK